MTATLINSSELKFGDLFTAPGEAGRLEPTRYLRLRPYETVDVASGHVYAMFYPRQVSLLGHIVAAPAPRRLRAAVRRQRAILGLLARHGAGEAQSYRQIRRWSRVQLPWLRPETAFRAALDALVEQRLITPVRAKVDNGLSASWADGYRATGPGLLQAVRLGLLTA